jgi:peptidoglycan/xylan/chitin deacetylase (PgdA/CDA1 family)
MKKKLPCLLLVFAMTFLSACIVEKAQEQVILADDPNPPMEAILPSFNATVEYGEPDLITDNTGPLWAYIRFPAAGNPTDEIIFAWANNVYQNACDEIAGLRKDDPQAEGEINIQFDSYFVDGRYAAILENGMFTTSHLAHPASVIRTFNIDTKTGALLSNKDILDYAQLESILAVMREEITEQYPDAADLTGEMDESWLEHITLGHSGVITMLERGKFLPSYLGAIKVTLPYDKLGPAFILGAETAIDPSAEPAADPPATPSADPPVAPPADPPATPAVDPPAESAADMPTSPAADPAIPTADSPPPTAESPIIPPLSGDIDPLKPMIALTFDDGPSKYTLQILATLEKHGGRATFCVVGNLVDARKDTVKRAFDLGHEIIGHSWDHRDLSKLSAAEIKKQLNDTAAAIEAVIGVYPMLYRPPYGAVSTTLKNTSGELGFALINWSVDTMDWSSRNADKVYKAVMSDASNRAIVLCHDLYGSTADAMERVIPELISQGYQLVTVTELMYYAGKTFQAGVVHYSAK